MDPDERKELLERLKLAHAEYLAELRADWDREKFLLTVNVLATMTFAIGATHSQPGPVSRVAFLVTAVAAVVCVFSLRIGRRRVREATARLLCIEEQLREPIVVPEGTVLDPALFAQGGGFVEIADSNPKPYERWPVVEAVLLLLAAADIMLAFL